MEFTIRQVCIPVIFCIGVNSYAITHPDHENRGDGNHRIPEIKGWLLGDRNC